MRKLLGTFDVPAPALPVVDDAVRRALEEDSAFDDRSTAPLPGRRTARRAEVVAREPGVLAGVVPFRRAFELVAAGAPVSVTGRGTAPRSRRGRPCSRWRPRPA